jgi:GxxExxY protein
MKDTTQNHPLARETDQIIGAAIEVHRQLGPGFRERIYENSLSSEMANQNLPFIRQPTIEVYYKETHVGTSQPDFICFDAVVVEIKAVNRSPNIFKAQALSYLKATDLKVALLLNFGRETLIDGLDRLIL